MSMILFPLICWQAALDMMGLSWTTGTWLRRTLRSVRGEEPVMPTRKPCGTGMLSVWLSPSLAESKAKFISRMRGSQSDPTHAHAPVCPRACARYARVNAGGARAGAPAREYHAPSRLARAG
jgi:hypothetical protein